MSDGSVKIDVKLDSQDFEKEINGLSAKVSKGLKEVSNSFKSIGGAMTDVGKNLTMGITTPLLGLATAATKVGTDFKSEMQNLAAITGMTADEMQQMEKGIRDIALTSGRSVTEVAANTKMLAEAGGDLGLVMEQLAHGTNLATATQTDMATTLDFLGSTMKTFGVEAEDTQSTVDSFAYVTTLANVELAQLGESYVNVGGSAANAGMSIDDVNAILVTFSNAGLKGGSAGTVLNGVLKNLSTPTNRAKKALDDLNVSLYDNEGQSRDMFAIMGELQSALGDMTDEQRNRYESIIFDTVAQQGWNMITAEGIGTIMELSSEISESAEAFEGLGQAAGMAAVQNDNLSGRVDLLKSSIAELGIQIFESLSPYLEKLVETIQKVVTWFVNADQQSKDLAVKIGLIAAAIGPVLLVGGHLVTAMGTITGAISTVTGAIAGMGTGATGLSAVLTALTGPIGIIIGSIGLLIAGFVYLWNTNEEFQANITTLWNSIQDSISSVIENIKGIFTGFIEHLSETGALEGIYNVILGTWEAIQTGLDAIWTAIFTIASTLFGGIADFFEENSQAITDILTTTWDIIWAFIEPIWKTINQIATKIFGDIKAFFQKWGPEIQAIFKNTFQIVFEVVKAIFDKLKAFWDNWGGTIAATFNYVLGAVKNVFTLVWNQIKNVVELAINTIRGIIKFVLAVIQGDWEGAWNAVKQVFKGIWDYIKNTIENIKTFIVNTFNNIKTFLSEIDLLEIGKNIIQGLIDGMTSMATAAWDAVKGIAGGIVDGVKDFLGIHSPSRVMREIGKNIGEGLIIGTEDMQSEVAQSGDELARAYIESITNGFDAGLSEAAVIMLGKWTDLNQGMTDIVKMTGADMVQAEIDTLDKLISETEKRNAEIAKAEELANKERAVAQAKSNDERIKAQDDLNKTLAKNELEALKEKRDMLKDQLKDIKDAYQQMSEAIVNALKERYSQEKDLSITALEGEVERRKEASAQIIEQYEREYAAKMKTLDIEESDEVRALQMKIDALDAQTDAEERALKEQDNQRKVFDLQQKVLQAESAEERIAAQEKLDAELTKQQRDALLQQRKDEKASLKEQITQVKDNYKAQRDNAKSDIDAKKSEYKQREEDTKVYFKNERTKIDEHYSVLMQKERIEAEARKMMIDGNQQEIVNLLNKYTPSWATAGQNAGQAFLNALQGVTPSIESEVQRIMSLINQASQVQSDLASMKSSVQSSNSSPTQQNQQSHTVKSGDTLSGIASKYGVSISALRNENGLSAADDKKLQVGRTLKIPILHEGGISLKEQFALIDKKEAVAPLADLYGMMERAVVTTANKLVSGFTQTIKNVSNVTTTHHEPKFEITVNYQGEMSRQDVNSMSRTLANQTARELRSRGLVTLG